MHGLSVASDVEGLDLDGSVSDLLLDNSAANPAVQSSQASVVSSQPAPSENNSSQRGTDDPFEKLHNLMSLNFASIKSDNSVMSGQLGLLQSNVVGLSTTVENLKSDVCGMNTRLTNVAAQAVNNKCNIASINKKLTQMQEDKNSDITDQVAAAVAIELKKTDQTRPVSAELEEKLLKMDKEMDKIRAVQAVQQISSSAGNNRHRLQQNHVQARDGPEDEARKYWAARRKLRCYPISQGSNRNDLLKNADEFFSQVLEIPAGELHEGAIVDIQKVPGKRRQKTQNETLITFDSVQTRDCVVSYASNLAGYSGDPANRPGLKLEVPDHLCGVFRVLERFAHTLKGQNPKYFKRSIKYDDVNLTLVLDYCTAQGAEWQRATFDDAAAHTRGRLTSSRSSTGSVPEDINHQRTQETGEDSNMEQQ